MARSDGGGARGHAALALGLAAALASCRRPERTTEVPVVVPTGVSTPTGERTLGTRARIVPFEPLPVDPEAVKVLARSFEKPPITTATEPPELTREALEDTARGEARGLALEGEIRAAQLGEADRVVLPIDLAIGECVTVIAHGGLGVMEVDAFLVRHGSSRVLAQDARNGPIAVVGGLAGCWPFVEETPTTLDVVVQSRKGEGPVVYAVYASRLPSRDGAER